jgi:hypothetical protein
LRELLYIEAEDGYTYTFVAGVTKRGTVHRDTKASTSGRFVAACGVSFEPDEFKEEKLKCLCKRCFPNFV